MHESSRNIAAPVTQKNNGEDFFSDGCILFFVKYPEEGQVKNRLSVDLKEISAVELYRNFIIDSLCRLKGLGITFHICCFPETSIGKFEAWLGDRYVFMPQHGKDLGARMSNSFSQAFLKGFRRVVVIGSDSPDLPGSFLKEAFTYLTTNDSVLGPTVDGGYYLIGFRNDTFCSETFENIAWSTNTVFQETRNILRNAGHKTHILPLWNDIDTLDDLKGLVRRSKKTAFSSSKTMCYLLHSNVPWVTP